MPDFFKNQALLVGLAAMVVFALSCMAFSPDALSDAIATVMSVACVAGLWRWAPTGWRVFWKGAKRTEDWGILAICMLLVSVILGRIYGVVFRQLGRPDYLVNSYWSPFFMYLLLGAVVLLVAATKDNPPQ